jgi:hypothetical protein
MQGHQLFYIRLMVAWLHRSQLVYGPRQHGICMLTSAALTCAKLANACGVSCCCCQCFSRGSRLSLQGTNSGIH